MLPGDAGGDNFDGGAKVSKKSSPSSWVNPLATTLALWHSTVPSEWYLILYTHLQPIVFFPGGRGVSCQVLLAARA